MQTIRVHGASIEGAGALIVTVEARFEPSNSGKTEVQLTGLPDAVLRESRGRLACTMAAAGVRPQPGRLHMHLVPAARPKIGEGLDLALVLAAAAATGSLAPGCVEGPLFLGEVGMDGRIIATPGGLAAAVAARERGIVEVLAPPESAAEVAAIRDVSVYAVPDLKATFAHLTRDPDEDDAASPLAPPDPTRDSTRDPASLDEVRGQAEAKLALQVSAAGGHAILLVGPPGAGKSMLARRLVDLMPPMTLDERVEVTSILSATGRWPKGLAARRPFRSPHHTASYAGLLGGGSQASPGEITLAHQGVLFLDELPEFGRDALEGLRQPLEEGSVHLSRATRRETFPARFHLAAAMNPCPCGFAGHPRVPCHCPPSAVRRYRRRISGPLLDRIDLRVALQPTPVEDLLDRPGEARSTPLMRTGAELADGVSAARVRALARADQDGLPNARLDANALDAVAPLGHSARLLLRRAAEDGELSARAIQSVRRVARTVADLAGQDEVGAPAIATALALRRGLT